MKSVMVLLFAALQSLQAYDISTYLGPFDFSLTKSVSKELVGKTGMDVLNGDMARLLTPKLITPERLRTFLDSARVTVPNEDERAILILSPQRLQDMVQVEVGKNGLVTGMIFFFPEEQYGFVLVLDKDLSWHSYFLRVTNCTVLQDKLHF